MGAEPRLLSRSTNFHLKHVELIFATADSFFLLFFWRKLKHSFLKCPKKTPADPPGLLPAADPVSLQITVAAVEVEVKAEVEVVFLFFPVQHFYLPHLKSNNLSDRRELWKETGRDKRRGRDSGRDGGR